MAKLIYFGGDFSGRTQPIRAFAAAAKFPLEFQGITPAEWGELKPKTPFGVIPVLELEDGSYVPESTAILQYVAEASNHAGHNARERASIHVVEAVFTDLAASFKFPDLEDDVKRNEIRTKFEEKHALLAKYLEGASSAGWAVGSDFTVADARIWAEVRRSAYFFEGYKAPAFLAAIADKFEQLPAVQEHLSVVPKEFLPRHAAAQSPYFTKRNAAYGWV